MPCIKLTHEINFKVEYSLDPPPSSLKAPRPRPTFSPLLKSPNPCHKIFLSLNKRASIFSELSDFAKYYTVFLINSPTPKIL